MTDDDNGSPATSPACASVSRRTFIRISGTALSGSLAAGIAPGMVAAAATPAESYPVTNVAELASIKVDAPILFAYPDANSPAALVRLPKAAPGGVGPESS